MSILFSTNVVNAYIAIEPSDKIEKPKENQMIQCNNKKMAICNAHQLMINTQTVTMKCDKMQNNKEKDCNINDEVR